MSETADLSPTAETGSDPPTSAHVVAASLHEAASNLNDLKPAVSRQHLEFSSCRQVRRAFILNVTLCDLIRDQLLLAHVSAAGVAGRVFNRHSKKLFNVLNLQNTEVSLNLHFSKDCFNKDDVKTKV